MDTYYETKSQKPCLRETARFAQTKKTQIYVFFLLMTLIIVVGFCMLICFPVWILALLFSYLDPTLGRFVNSFDSWMDEDFINNIPRNPIVITIKLDGQLTLEQLKTVFNANVLQATLSSDRSKLRYPELQQYLTRFLGFRVWKWDDSFDIDNHITQQIYDVPVDISDIHQELTNKRFPKNKSPWELILINQVNGNSVIAARLHHCMTDGKSILKLFVECLGQKPLKTAQPLKSNIINWFQFILFYPIKLFQTWYMIIYDLCNCEGHPLIKPDSHDDRFNVAFSPQLKLADIKLVAKRNGVTSSSVVMSLVAGAIRKCGEKFGDRDVMMGYPLPMENHPEQMRNHVYIGVMHMPTDQPTPIKRLRKCNEIFLNTKASHQVKYTICTTTTWGFPIYPLGKRLPMNHSIPMFLTNIAGDEEGFSVKQVHCQDFRMSVGTLNGVAGVCLCAFSYKDGMYVGITTKDKVLSKAQTAALALDIELELKQLIVHSKI